MKGLARAIAAVLSSWPILAQPIERLTPRDVDAAIAWGRDGDPAPYLLRFKSYQKDVPSTVIVGSIYTPFVRIALAAKAAFKSGPTFESQDVTEEMTEEIFYVAFRWYCCVDPDHGDRSDWHPRTDPFDYQIVVPGDPAIGLKPWRVTTRPL